MKKLSYEQYCTTGLFGFLLLCLCFVGLGVPKIVKADSIFDSYTGATSGTDPVNNSNWDAQTFTASANYEFDGFDLDCEADSEGTPNNATGYLYSVNAGLPNDLLATSETKDVSDLTSSLTVVHFSFSGSTALTEGTQYAVAWQLNESSFYLRCAYATTNPYAGGQFSYSGNSGSSWTGVGGDDFYFATYGTASPTTTPGNDFEGTSTPDQTQENIFNGIVLFALAFAGILWILGRVG